MFSRTLSLLSHLLLPLCNKVLRARVLSIPEDLFHLVKIFSLTSIVVSNPKHDLSLLLIMSRIKETPMCAWFVEND
jgi:hypothetical protein